ncbi:dihydroorotase [Thermolongibacillus altinsuensis]|uniref:Dihydroorotase n=1 Tax=Thermolongibacillus altinsuensis TaxID=575256 RepID=A0A4R1QPK0_9BACL|nr:dihydroorotase [Thermolongibacillus altinsuensis]TCL50305.1 dihydroorotase [Thermolongibacillus altinsuensis]
MAIILKNARSLNKEGQLEPIELKIVGEIIAELSSTIEVTTDDEVIDVNGQLLAPGFIDLHVHLREPGGEHKETIATGTLAAAKGGFTTIAAMPNTRPVPDTKEQMEWLYKRIRQTAHVNVLPYASITVRQLGRQLTNFVELKEAGAFAFTDDGVGVQSAQMMYEAMKQAAALNMPIVAHCEDETLTYKGAVHDGTFAKKHRLAGIPSVCESVHIARDVLLAEATGCHYHVCHISTKESVRVVRDAKRAGIRVTAEVTPHHLLLCDEDIPGLNANFKMNPPLRSKEDRDALVEGILDGTIDFIATDHAPHTEAEKQEGMELAPFGIVGLETAFPLLYTHFVETKKCTLKQLVDWFTKKPAEAFKIHAGTLAVGAKADVTVIDLHTEEAIDPNAFVSKGKNTPFAGWKCKGWPTMTFVSGKLVWQKGREQ